jgi:hypothetical protein
MSDQVKIHIFLRPDAKAVQMVVKLDGKIVAQPELNEEGINFLINNLTAAREAMRKLVVVEPERKH